MPERSPEVADVVYSDRAPTIDLTADPSAEPGTQLVPMPRTSAEPPDEPFAGTRASDVDQWGRSESLRKMIRAVYSPMYKYWFRAEWESFDLLPPTGGALLVSNHAGAIPSDAPVIMHGIEEDLGRPVYGLAENLFRALPAIGTIWSRVGGVAANPDNAYRLLHDEQQLVLVFPEGTKGTGKPYRERYQLRRFGRGGFVEIAMRAGVPVIPIAVVGAEESMPIVWKSNRLAKALNLPYAPITANMLAFGPLGLAMYFPSKFRLRVLPPVQFDVPPDQERYSRSKVMDGAELIRSQIQSALYEMLPRPIECLVGLMRVLVTGISSYWGGKLAQELEARSDVEVVVGLDSREPRVPLERTEFVRADSSYSILSRIVQATQIDTVLHTHMIVDSTQSSGRRLHEINVIGTMNLLAAAGAAGSTVRKVVLKSSAQVYGANFQDPTYFREETTRTRAAKTNVERSLLEVESFLGDFAEDNPHVCVTLLRFANVLGPDIETPFTSALRMRWVPEIFGFDPRLQFVHEDDVVGALMYATENDVAGIYNVAGDDNIPWSEVCATVRKRRIPLPFLLTNLAVEPLRMLRILDLPPEGLALLRYGRSLDNTRLKRAGFRYRYTTPGAVEAFAQALRLEATIGDTNPSYRYEREVESFFRHSPAVVRGDKRRASDHELAGGVGNTEATTDHIS